MGLVLQGLGTHVSFRWSQNPVLRPLKIWKKKKKNLHRGKDIDLEVRRPSQMALPFLVLRFGASYSN